MWPRGTSVQKRLPELMRNRGWRKEKGVGISKVSYFLAQ